MTRIIPQEKVSPQRFPNSSQLNPESVAALQAAKENEGQWVVWQSGFPHHRASKVQAFNLRHGKKQKSLTDGLLDPDGDGILEFKAWTDRDTEGSYCVLAKYTTAKFRVAQREKADA